MICFTLLTTVRFRPFLRDPTVFLCLGAPQAWGGGRRRTFLVTKKRNTLLGKTYIFVGATTMLRMPCEGVQDRPRRRLGSRAVSPSAGRQPLVLLGFLSPTRWLVGMRATSSTRQSRVRSVYRGGGALLYFVISFLVGVTRASVVYVAVRAVIILDITLHYAKEKNIRHSCPLRSHLCEWLKSAVKTLLPPCLPLPHLNPRCSCGARLRNER